MVKVLERNLRTRHRTTPLARIHQQKLAQIYWSEHGFVHLVSKQQSLTVPIITDHTNILKNSFHAKLPMS